MYLAEDFETERVEEQIPKSDAKMPVRRKLSMMKRSLKTKTSKQLSTSVVVEENEEEFLEPRTRISKLSKGSNIEDENG